MIRFFALLSAVVMALVAASLATRGAGDVMLFFRDHPLPKWFGRDVAVFVAIFSSWIPIAIAMKRRRRDSKPNDDGRLTPRVRRHPSGMREL